MRSWQAECKADIMVSELLGSFGDNELSPECLDGAQRYLKGSEEYRFFEFESNMFQRMESVFLIHIHHLYVRYNHHEYFPNYFTIEMRINLIM